MIDEQATFETEMREKCWNCGAPPMVPTVVAQPETIVAAAALDSNGVVHSLPKPARHGDVLMSFARVKPPIEGFITSTGRFVQRDEAWLIAHSTRQIPTPLLTTEDLW